MKSWQVLLTHNYRVVVLHLFKSVLMVVEEKDMWVVPGWVTMCIVRAISLISVCVWPVLVCVHGLCHR